MSEQPPRASGHLPRPDEVAPKALDSGGEAPLPGERTPLPDEPLDAAQAHPAAPLHAARHDPQERIRGSAGERLDQAADAARRLGHRAREQGGIAGRAEPLAYRVGDSLQSAASYVRGTDVGGMRDDIETGVRAAPIRALAVAAVAGFAFGRLLR